MTQRFWSLPIGSTLTLPAGRVFRNLPSVPTRKANVRGITMEMTMKTSIIIRYNSERSNNGVGMSIRILPVLLLR